MCFLAEYLESGNASDAAIKAGYSPKHISKQAGNLLQHPEIKRLIENSQKISRVTAIYGIEQAVQEADELRNEAIAANQFGPAVSAFTLKLKLYGLLEDRIRVEHADISMALADARKRAIEVDSRVVALLPEPGKSDK